MSDHSATLEPDVIIAPLAEREGRRAPALSLSDRRGMIIDAVIPLLIDNGADVTSKQIAEAAGIAEGTVFRAFGDKESLIRAAAEKFFDPETVIRGLRGIDPEDSLESKVAQLISIMRTRFTGAFKLMAATGHQRPPANRGQHLLEASIESIFAPDAARLAWTPRQVAHLIRLLSFASAVPEINQVDTPFSVDELARIILHGIAVPDSPLDSGSVEREGADA